MLSSRIKDVVRPLLELNDKIYALTREEADINATSIVVVGDQSHGKSSCLEALSGIDLPRGEDIKTRVPLVMQLRSIAADEDEYAVISSSDIFCHEQRIALSDVAAKVDELTAKLAGSEKGVEDKPIYLEVHRHDQEDLTLVDLPGITRVAREGQGGSGAELEALIKGMARQYCEPKETIILNVVSAMVDFSTSASLQLSQELDPSGRRTLLCVTKVDQHAEAGLARKARDAIKQMRLGNESVFLVRNRSQRENEQKLPLAEARKLEMDYFERNKELQQGVRQGYGLGVKALSERLVKIQLERIVATLPGTRCDPTRKPRLFAACAA